MHDVYTDLHTLPFLCSSYREIRQEVAFLSALDHPHLTQLCGVRTRPNMCLLLELAPLGSLRQQLKDYHNHNLVLEPLTLKLTTLQVSWSSFHSQLGFWYAVLLHINVGVSRAAKIYP